MSPKLTIGQNDLLRIDGIPIAKLIALDGVLLLEFKDGDRLRSECRGSCFISIPLLEFVSQIQVLHDPTPKQEDTENHNP